MALSSDKSKPAAPASRTAAPAEEVRPVSVDTREAHTDRVAMVSRDKNGNPDQGSDFEIIGVDDMSDDEKRRAENRPEVNQVDTGEKSSDDQS